MDFRYNEELVVIGFDGCKRERKRRIEDDFLVFDLSSLMNGCFFYWFMENLERNKICGKIKIFVCIDSLINLLDI